MKRGTPMKRGKPVKRANVARRKSEFARCFHSKRRVEFVKGLPCLICGQGPSDNAHLGNKGAGVGRRADYDQIAPLCRRCHTKVDEGWMHFDTYSRSYMAHHTEMRWQSHIAHLKQQEPTS